MIVRRLACYLTAAGTAMVLLLPSAQAEPRAVIELFTSQGCSSCPPADKLVGELVNDPSLIVMSLAVDYWDYLGWKDTMALTGHTRRQKAYAKVRGDREIYTPQAVVNGSVHVRGSDRAAIEQAIVQTRKNTATLALPVVLTKMGDKVTVAAPAGRETRGEVWLCPITRKVEVPIDRGENRGKTITYHNIVRRWIKLGDWSGKGETWNVPITDLAVRDGATSIPVDTVAVVVQTGVAASPGAMLGAAIIPLR